MMKYWQKKQTRYGVGGITAAALLYGFFRLYKYLRYTPPVRSQIREVSELKKISKEIQNASHVSNASQHIPYGNLVEDPLRFKPKASTLTNYRHIKDLSYRIILGLAKGNSYQGIVNISFNLEEIQDFQHKVYLNFNGGGIKYLMINGKVLVAKQIEYKDHEVLLPRFLLREGSRNRVEVIFQNYYSFLNEGLCTYFTVDQNQKYSLRQQVIYSINGYKDIQNIIPCFNCLNQCKVQLEVIHSDTFDVFSNTPKSLQRLCSVAQYHQYPFLFQLGAISLSRSYKLNQSTPSSITGQCSGIEQNISMSLSTANYYNRKKANTHFYKQKLPCLNHLFIFCSPMMQLQPTSLNNPLQSELLLRYFCKHDSSHRLMRNVNRIHNYILDLFKKLQSENIKSYINKIDLLIIADADVEGYFAPGVILLSEDSLKEQVVGIKCLYLLARALLGLLQLEKGKKLISLNEILALNELVFNKFEQFRAYLYIKNQKIKKINALLNNPNNFKQITKYEGYFLRYYSKELRYLLKNQNRDKVSLQVVKLVSTINIQNPHQFWTILLSNYSFLPSLIIEPLIKLGLRTIKLPKNVQIVQQLKSCFSNSKYVLSFYSNEEISDNLPRFIEAQTYGLEQRLVNIKVKQKFKDYITQKYQKYLPIRSNINDAENDYHAFKQFNQIKNFHHFTVLKKQMKRITYFGKQFLAGEKINIVCSIMGWKLLKIIRITPADEQLHKMLEAFQLE